MPGNGRGAGAANSIVIGPLWYFELLGETARQIPASLMLPVLLLLPVEVASLMLTRLLLGDSWFTLENGISLTSTLLRSLFVLPLVLVAGLGVEVPSTAC